MHKDARENTRREIVLKKFPRVRIGYRSSSRTTKNQACWTPRILFVRRSSDISQDALYREDFSFHYRARGEALRLIHICQCLTCVISISGMKSSYRDKEPTGPFVATGSKKGVMWHKFLRAASIPSRHSRLRLPPHAHHL